MQRLTSKHSIGNGACKLDYWVLAAPDHEGINKLADYEDTGLDPEDVPTALEMVEIYAALKKLKEYETAEEQGLLVKLNKENNKNV